MNEIDSKTKTLPDKAVATESDDGSLSSLGLQRLPRQRRFHVPTVSLRELPAAVLIKVEKWGI